MMDGIWREVPNMVDGIEVRVRDANAEDKEHAKRYRGVLPEHFVAAFGTDKRKLGVAVFEKYETDEGIVSSCLPLLRNWACDDIGSNRIPA